MITPNVLNNIQELIKMASNKKTSSKYDAMSDVCTGADHQWSFKCHKIKRKELKDACCKFVPVSGKHSKTINQAARLDSVRTAMEHIQKNIPRRKNRYKSRATGTINTEIAQVALAVFGENTDTASLIKKWDQNSLLDNVLSTNIGECGMCMSEFNMDGMTSCNHSGKHLICGGCFSDHFSEAVINSIVKYRKCQYPDCMGYISEKFIRSNLTGVQILRLNEINSNMAERTFTSAGLKIVHCKKCALTYAVDPKKVYNSKVFCTKCHTVMCLRCNKTHANADAPCPVDTDGLGRFAKKLRICGSCGARVHKKSGCQHITCHCGAEFCYGCNRYNSISSTCPGPGRWHSTRFKCPVCFNKQHLSSCPNGPFNCTTCKSLLIIQSSGNVIAIGM